MCVLYNFSILIILIVSLFKNVQFDPLLCFFYAIYVFFFIKICKIIIKSKREKDIFDFNYNFMCFSGLNCT